MEQNHSFRTAGFGGFHRQDVLDYIKETAERHKDQIEELQKSLKKAEEEQAQLRTRLDEAEQTVREAEEARAALEQQLNDSRSQAEGYARLKSDYAEIELDARQRAALILEQANGKARQSETDAAAKAAQIIEQAQQQADHVRADAQDDARHAKEERRQLLERTRRDFSISSDDLKSSVSTALREVDQVRQLLLDLRTTFEENVHAVDDLCGEED